jgi:hypothetical protein
MFGDETCDVILAVLKVCIPALLILETGNGLLELILIVDYIIKLSKKD